MMEQSGIYQDIATRTGGDIYIGVVGPVRTGKSTFIKQFMEKIVLPQMSEEPAKKRAQDEIPQSGSGKNVMTTEPKFVPDEAVRIEMESGMGFRVKMIDCVGFPVPDAQGLEEEGEIRMVNTPWSEKPMPFEEAARLGTVKVMTEHSTIGVVVTTDGSIGQIKRESYADAEEAVIRQMKETAKPFVVVMNSQHPEREETKNLAKFLQEKYTVPVLAKNCYLITKEEILDVLSQIVLEFPVRKINIQIPTWLRSLEKNHPTRERVMEEIDRKMKSIRKTGEVKNKILELEGSELFSHVATLNSDLGCGSIHMKVQLCDELYYSALTEACGVPIDNESDLMLCLREMSGAKAKYDRIAEALKQVEETGYGIVPPSLDDLMLEEPEIVKQSGGYGVKLKASAPSIHMIRANIQAEISPIVGSERQSEDIVKFLLKEFEEEPKEIWHSNLFGKSLYELVNEGLNTKLNHMPQDARDKIGETLQKIINEGSGGLICIIL